MIISGILNIFKVINPRAYLSIGAVFLAKSVNAQDIKVFEDSHEMASNMLLIAFGTIAFLLALVILAFAEKLRVAVFIKREKELKKRNDNLSSIKSILLLVSAGIVVPLFSGVTNSFAKSVEDHSAGMNSYLYYIIVPIIITEIIIIGCLYLYSRNLSGIAEARLILEKASVISKIKSPSLLEKLNASVAIEKEEEIIFDHEYDGIRELDNDLPPWWKYGFYLSILVAILYMVHYHVSDTGALQLDEYEMQLTQAKSDAEESRKKSANLVDENNVELLSDENSITGGKLIFITHCSACHGKSGEGTVGPNLTDDYWIHKGSIRDIFRSVKYGWPEKGMKAWQQDLGAKQIHEVSSYIKSLRGINPLNSKEKQGEIYIEENNSDSSITGSLDSIKLAMERSVNE